MFILKKDKVSWWKGNYRHVFFFIKELISGPQRSPNHAFLKDINGGFVEKDCELGMFAKWSSVKLIILSDNESRALQG